MTRDDIIDDIVRPDDAPRRIYGWLDSQLSIARFSGGCTINGVAYHIRYDVEGQPLEEVVVKPKRRKAKK